MLNQTALSHTRAVHWSTDVAPVAAALRRGLLTLTALTHPTRGSGRAVWESCFDAGVMRRELYRL
jgi:hypothetical protein